MIYTIDQFYRTKEKIIPKLDNLFAWQKEHFKSPLGYNSGRNKSMTTQGAYYSLMSTLMAREQLDMAAKEPDNIELIAGAKRSIYAIYLNYFHEQLGNGIYRMIDNKLKKIGINYSQLIKEFNELNRRSYWS